MIFRLRRLKRERTTKTKKKREKHDIMIIFLKKKKKSYIEKQTSGVGEVLDRRYVLDIMH